MADITEWSPIDDDNNQAPPNGWPENQSPSSVNNCARAMMGAIRRWYDTVTTKFGDYLPLAGGTVTGLVAFNGPGVTFQPAPTAPVVTWQQWGTGLRAYNETGGEIITQGSLCGFVFADRDNVSPGWEWYAQAGVARLALGGTGDLIRVTWPAGVIINTPVSVQSLASAAGITAVGGITAASVAASGNVSAANVIASGTVSGAAGGFTGNLQGSVVLGTQALRTLDIGGGYTSGMYTTGGHTFLNYFSNHYWDYNGSTGELGWYISGTLLWSMRETDSFCWNQRGPVGGQGAYVNLSDRRTKQDIAPSQRGLLEVLELQPAQFRRAEGGRLELGFVAQDVEMVLPEAVVVAGIELSDGTGGLGDPDPTLGLAGEAIVAALVNAVKELTARIEVLEGGNP